MAFATEPKSLVFAHVSDAQLQDIVVEYEGYKKQFCHTESRESVSIPAAATVLDA